MHHISPASCPNALIHRSPFDRLRSTVDYSEFGLVELLSDDKRALYPNVMQRMVAR